MYFMLDIGQEIDQVNFLENWLSNLGMSQIVLDARFQCPAKGLLSKFFCHLAFLGHVLVL